MTSVSAVVRIAILAIVLIATPASVFAQAAAQTPNNLNLQIENVGTVSAPLQIVLLMTLLTFVPALLVTMTSFTRIVIVFHFLRQALGTQEQPSNQILIGLAFFLTMFIMAPVGERVSTLALQPAMDGKISMTEAITRATPPVREFMLKQTREKDLAVFVELGKLAKPATPDDLPMRVVVPAFVISELKTGFQMGFFLFVPVPAHRSGGFDHPAVDGHDAVAARDDLAAVQGDVVRDDRRLEPDRRVAGAQLRLAVKLTCLKLSSLESCGKPSSWPFWSACRCCWPE